MAMKKLNDGFEAMNLGKKFLVYMLVMPPIIGILRILINLVSGHRPLHNLDSFDVLSWFCFAFVYAAILVSTEVWRNKPENEWANKKDMPVEQRKLK